jgi:alpha-1,2-mannosyltransferase
VWLARASGGEPGWDFAIYGTASERAAAGDDPYSRLGQETGFVNHPALLLLVYPFRLAGGAGATVWFAVLLAAWVGAAVLSFDPTERRGERLVLLLLLSAAAEGLIAGQAALPAVFCLAAAYRCHRANREMEAGVLIGLAVVFKLSLGVFILYFLVLRRFRSAAAAGAVLILLTALAEWLLYPGVTAAFFRTTAGLAAEAHPGAFNAAVYFPPVTPLIAVFALAALAITTLRRGNLTDARPAFGGFAAWTLLASPLTWHHHFVFLALPLAILLARRPWVGLALAGAVQVDLLGQAAGLPVHTSLLAAGAILLMNFIPWPGDRDS